MNISFGKKIPIATCQIINEAAKKPETVTIFEHDCKDIEDFEYFKNLKGSWVYKNEIAKSALQKFNEPSSKSDTKIYSMETKRGKTTGIMEVSQYGKLCDVQHLESHYKGLYSLSGTSLLAYLAKEQLNYNAESIFVSNPALSARKFYTRHCFFEPYGPIALELNQKGMKKLINKTEKTILNLEG